MSFHPVKPITTGEGGVALTNNKNLAKKMKLLRTHGIEKSLNNKIKHKIGDWYYENRELGFNFRLSDIHASLGISQLKNLNILLKERNKIASRYDKIFKDNKNIVPLKIKSHNYTSYHLYVIRLVSNKVNFRNKLIKFLKSKNIFLNVHYIPIHYHPYYKNLKIKKGSLKNSEKYFDQAISLPIYVGLKKKDQFYVSKCINDYILNY